MPKKQIQDLEKLDKTLAKIEKRFSTKLDKYYSELESSTLRKVSKYKSGDKIIIPDSKQAGLDNLFRNHFKNIERVTTEFTKNELSGIFNKPDDLEKIRLLKLDKMNKYNIKYAKELSVKQVQDYQDKIKDTLTNALKTNPNLSTKELKELVKRDTQSFKNTRVDTTSTTEATRVKNESKIELYKKMDLKKVRFIMTREKYLKNINCKCELYNQKVFFINSPNLPSIPQHPNCACEFIPA